MKNFITFAFLLLMMSAAALAQMPATIPATRPAKTQAELEADFAAMMTNATLEGSYVSTAAGVDPTKLSSDRYNLGTVRKLAGNLWLIQARLGYGQNERAIPLPLP